MIGELVLISHKIVSQNFYFFGVFGSDSFLTQFFYFILGTTAFVSKKFTKAFPIRGHITSQEEGSTDDHVVYRGESFSDAVGETVQRESGHSL